MKEASKGSPPLAPTFLKGHQPRPAKDNQVGGPFFCRKSHTSKIQITIFMVYNANLLTYADHLSTQKLVALSITNP
jgi:hypothetical protein